MTRLFSRTGRLPLNRVRREQVVPIETMADLEGPRQCGECRI